MKRVTRLIGPQRAAKSSPKEGPAGSYNVFASGSAKRSPPATQAAPTPLARVHNYGRANASQVPSSSTGKIQYAALNRMRKKRSEGGGAKRHRSKSKWRRLLGKCWGKKRRYWSSPGAKSRGGILFSCCGCCARRKPSQRYEYDSEEEDDDIDAKVAAYMLELKQREAVVASKQSENPVEETPSPVPRSSRHCDLRAWLSDEPGPGTTV